MTMRRIIATMLGLLAPVPAAAHPHVLIDAHAVLEMKDGMVVSLFVGWKFDPVYGGTLALDFDADKNGKLDAAEMATMEREAFQDTREHSYFTHIRVGGQPVTGLVARDFKVLMIKESMLYSFRLPLPRPVNPRTEKVTVSAYEETYYIDILFPSDKAVVLNGDGAAGCRAVLSDDRENPLLGGVVFPKKVDVECD